MKRARLLIPLLLIALGLGVVGWRAWNQAWPPIIHLSDGSWLEYRAVTAGTSGKFDYGPPWQRLVAQVPGKFAQKYVGRSVVNAGYDSRTEAVFWFVRRGGRLQTNVATQTTLVYPAEMMRTAQLIKRTPMPPVVSVVPYGGLRANMKDEQGDGEPGYRSFTEVNLPNGEVATFWSARAVPRRSPTLKLCLYEFPGGAGGRRLGEVIVPNPLYRKQP